MVGGGEAAETGDPLVDRREPPENLLGPVDAQAGSRRTWRDETSIGHAGRRYQ